MPAVLGEFKPYFRGLSPTRNLVDRVVEQVRQQVLAGRPPVGEPLPAEGKLAEQFGVSRTVIREAMQRLRAEGMIDIAHGRRPRVKAPSPEASIESLVTWVRRSDVGIHQLLEVRRPLECEIVQIAARKADAVSLEAIRETIDVMHAAATLRKRIDADAAFHRGLAEATGNPVFVLLLDAMAALLDEQRTRTLRGPGAKRAAQDHQIIYQCVAAGDCEAAVRAMNHHLTWPRD